jgi:hypothetical protein
VFGSCNVVLNCMVMCFTDLYLGLSFQLTVWQSGFCSLCSFMVPGMFGALGFMVMYFQFFYCVISVLNITPYVLLLFVISCGNFVKIFWVVISSVLL